MGKKDKAHASVSFAINGIDSLRLEINEKGQYVLPFSRRVIGTGFPPNRQTAQPAVQTTSSPAAQQTEQQFITIVDRRPHRYTYNSVLKDYRHCGDDIIFFNSEDAFQSFVHRMHSDHYNRADDCADSDDENDDDADDVAAEGDKSSEEYMDNFIKWNRARLGLPMPKEWENPFNKH